MPSERVSWRNAKQQASVAKDDDSVSLVFGPNGFVEEVEEYTGNGEEYDETEEEELYDEDEDESNDAEENSGEACDSSNPVTTVDQIVPTASAIPVEPRRSFNSVNIQDTPLTYIDDSSQIDPLTNQSHHDSWTIFDSNPTSKWASHKAASILDIGPSNTKVSSGTTGTDVAIVDNAGVVALHSDINCKPAIPTTKPEHEPEPVNSPSEPALAAVKETKPKWTKTLKSKSFDNDHEVISPGKSIGWQKPTWTKGMSLKNIHSNNTVASPEKNISWQKPNWTTATLRSTGKNIKDGIDLEAPITHCRKCDNMDDINFEANPMVLKPSSKGTDVRLGENLAKPITHCAKDVMGDVNFEACPEFALKSTEIGTKLKEKGDLQAPITHIPRDHLMDDINFEANPLILKPTEKGSAVRMGENLARPITFIIAKRPSEEVA